MVPVKVKWGRETFELTVDLRSTVKCFKEQLQQLTSVPVERQKIMGVKASQCNDNEVTLEAAGVAAGKTLMLIGTAAEVVRATPIVATGNKDSAVQAPASHPAEKQAVGLQNIANTCYMNAAVQMLRLVPEVRDVLNFNANDPIVSELLKLYNTMDTKRDPVVPASLWSILLAHFPTFAEVNEKGHPMQHDSQEALNALLQRINSCLPESHKRLFTGNLSQKMVCKDDPDDQPVLHDVPFLMLSCNIDAEIETLEAGLEAAFNETVKLHSEKLAREALHTRTSRIATMPEYLFIHMVRFSWRSDIQSKAKILKPVTFPMTLDLHALCAEEYKPELEVERKRVLKRRDIEMERRRAAKNKTKLDDDEAAPADDASNTAEPINTTVGNHSGYYELCGVISHKGRSADSGHYVFWGKYADQWMVLDDSNTAAVSEEDVKRLRGSGEAHIAYVLMYRSRDPRTKQSVIPL
ncbi:cysteine peptidase, Clan CA, family C19,putative [Trypanosoma brucei gambiense DAL972]|uniref:Ubiquitin carboxyl-terminal hydrolase n=2 Tax=Trypanosoma brucei TaxID=5691 RepID=C9ZN32_TRYB9|nr:cysteine peptidase, Clan CA, family C19,putative [Trypanosoma brucei gambiense DAL972]RHW73308.1 ubiquitin carboxyl-terminal hydrolase [Trypanosoma brucei equiperdum]CBH10686.1 cysteine peptidase, Clan CA, family C19,putative [Trypanosoma brucei gambiense DAL972]|eukprot:XP_011772974.1 cysteine peptidase, Clan CA, family C19,putative [Trypanosoma brucei gambiense DAL972]